MGLLFGIWGGMWLIFGLINVAIMTSKLRSGWGGFFLGLLGVIGLVIAIVMKDYRPYLKDVGVYYKEDERDEESSDDNTSVGGTYMKDGQPITMGQIRIEVSNYLQSTYGVPTEPVHTERTTAQKLQNLDNLLADNLITKTEYNKMTKEVMNEHKNK